MFPLLFGLLSLPRLETGSLASLRGKTEGDSKEREKAAYANRT